MATMRDIRRRIRSVANIQQITRAMKMVAVAKLRRVQGRMLAMRPYTADVTALLGRFRAELIGDEHPLLQRRPIRKVGLLFLAGERGLCGSFNHNLVRACDKFLRDHSDTPVEIVAIGKKAVDHCTRQKYSLREKYVDVYDSLSYSLAAGIATRLAEAYARAEFDALYFLYARFVTTLHQEISVVQVLPLAEEVFQDVASGVEPKLYLVEPDAESFATRVINEFLTAQTYQAMLETAASEHAARMTAMDTATNNADDMIASLTLELNRARQTSITMEILDIVGGSEALRSG